MKKIVFIAVVAILSISAQAQNIFDYYGLTTPSINGTARYMAMGGSFGALGGDASAIADNPAVLGIFRSNELSFSLNVNPIHTRSAWNTYSIGSDKTKVIANNLTWVLNFPTYRERGFIHSNLSFSFNRLKNFGRNGYIKNSNSQYSLTSLIANMTNGLTEDKLKFVKNTYDPYDNPDVGYLSVLGYEGYLIDPIASGSDQWKPAFGGDISSSYRFTESGYIDEYNFTYSGNINDVLYFGTGLSIQNYTRRVESYYEEFFSDGNNFSLHNATDISGTGVNLDLGIIARLSPTVRLGASFSTPTWYSFSKVQASDIVSTKMSAVHKTPTYETLYGYTSPLRVQLSAGFVIKQHTAINIDYIFMDNKIQRVKNSSEKFLAKSEFDTENNNLRKYTLNTHTIRVGAETKISKHTKLRLGGGYMTAPIASGAQKDFNLNTTLTAMEYFVNNPQWYGSCGIGFQFSNFFLDFAYVYNKQEQDFVPFTTDDSSFKGAMTNHNHSIVTSIVLKY